MNDGWRLDRLADAAVSVRLHDGEPLEVNARVHALAAGLRLARVRGVRDIVPGMRDLVVHIDPLGCDLSDVERALADTASRPSVATTAPAAVIEIPVVYGGADGPDLDDVARACGMSAEDVCARHALVDYVVCMIGFLPGFPYLGLLEPSLRLPRRRSPRSRVAPGSVAIAGEYTGVYPCESPGGWHVIGRTVVSLFDLADDPPARLAPGDRVRFVRSA